jgi:hypothetical protein
MSCLRQLVWQFLIIWDGQRYKQAVLQSEDEIKGSEAVLTSYVLELLGQFLVFFFQGKKVPTNL